MDSTLSTVCSKCSIKSYCVEEFLFDHIIAFFNLFFFAIFFFRSTNCMHCFNYCSFLDV